MKEGKPYVMFGDGNLASCKPISEADLASFIADCVTETDKVNQVSLRLKSNRYRYCNQMLDKSRHQGVSVHHLFISSAFLQPVGLCTTIAPAAACTS